MKKNYYEILEVSENASQETIEKVYKMLAKKYHPDLQSNETKAQAEEIIKEINMAYETLSNPKLRAEYDRFLVNERNSNSISRDEYEKLKDELNRLKTTSNFSNTSNSSSSAKKNNVSDLFFSKKTQEQYNNQSHIFTLKTPTLKNILVAIITFFIVLLVMLILPFTRSSAIGIFSFLGNLVVTIFKSFFL